MKKTVAAALFVLASVSGLGRTAQPDLVTDQQELDTSWLVEKRYFPPNHCALVEGCIGDWGYRRLLRFSVVVANVSTVDLALGDPSNNPLFTFSPCHGHYHLDDFSDYSLLDLQGNPVAAGHKQAFCLTDTIRYLNDPGVPMQPRYDCTDQGIQRGWADIYTSNLDCQWIDVTDLPLGNYLLRVTLNPVGILAESNLSNNTATTQVVVSEPPGIPHRPDGVFVPGMPVTVEQTPQGLRVRYDVSFCPATNYNLYYGRENSPSSHTYTGAVCNLGASGTATVTLPDPAPGKMIWFTVVGRNAGVEGGHGHDSAGRERPLTGAGFCGVTLSQPSSLCSP